MPMINHISTVVSIAGIAMKIIGIFPKFDEQKKMDAIENIEKQLNDYINDQESQSINSASGIFINQSKNICDMINTYLGELIDGLVVILNELREAQKLLTISLEDINLGYAKRILDYCQDYYEPLTSDSIQASISSVERDFAKQITIHLNPDFSIKKILDLECQKKLEAILQENISIIHTNKGV